MKQRVLAKKSDQTVSADFTRKCARLTHTFPEVGNDPCLRWQALFFLTCPDCKLLVRLLFYWGFFVYFFVFIAGLESYMVHSQPRLDTVLPEHSACVGPLHLPVVVGPFLLSSSLLPRPWTDPNVQPLHHQNGENWQTLSVLGWSSLISFSQSRSVKRWSRLLVFKRFFPPSLELEKLG